MASLQDIIDNATFINISRKKMTAQSVSRSGRLLTAEVASAVPYRFTTGMHEGLKWSENRALPEVIDQIDLTTESTIDIGSTNTNLSYITSYQGDLTTGQVGALRVLAATGSGGANIYLNCSLIGAGAGYLFKAGDLIQPANGYRYPYTVTEDVVYSTSANVTIPVHRPVITQDSYTISNQTVLVGSDVQWRVKLVNKPTYSVMPYDRLVFNSEFQMIEVIRKEDG